VGAVGPLSTRGTKGGRAGALKRLRFEDRVLKFAFNWRDFGRCGILGMAFGRVRKRCDRTMAALRVLVLLMALGAL